MAATAERFGQRPSSLLGIPASDTWFAYCVDEALHTLQSGHETRDSRWHDRFRRHDDDEHAGPNLYEKAMNDPRTGKPPTRAELDAIRYAAEHSGMIGRDE